MKNKIAVVTGGGSGIGYSICKALGEANYKVIVLDLNLAAAEATATEIKTTGWQADAFAVDVSNAAAVSDVFAQITQDNKSIDILINNAGIGSVGTIEETSEQELDKVYNVNVKGVYNCAAAVVPIMKAQRAGIIINMASIASTVGIPDRFAYSMSKGAVLTMTYSIARDYVDYGIRCNCIAPGRVHTPFVEGYLEKNYADKKEEMFEKLSKSQPIGRMGTPEEIAGLVQYLCSEQASFITGTNIPIDGGFVTINN
ncbi:MULTISPECIES: SDR family oxidoreductase [unclassified Pseudoalteromonas]|uniref:SDR family NAD(P)-dependent oxidoreductase n=1 Tax=unclassified Pseudoalteromonas TaxID=194690 RepID=UPI0025B4B5DB|nr:MULTISPECIES: SDR family oxidoreductase [unclassified Pseudoalteromonas]MDN3377716.1 SDR family oxidoreductase [Pseudoalteromonas sp. APC 3893]MDN3385912.1 SDR family oxidoreductase [Pseudoalteromonas sp. APC 4017]